MGECVVGGMVLEADAAEGIIYGVVGDGVEVAILVEADGPCLVGKGVMMDVAVGGVLHADT